MNSMSRHISIGLTAFYFVGFSWAMVTMGVEMFLGQDVEVYITAAAVVFGLMFIAIVVAHNKKNKSEIVQVSTLLIISAVFFMFGIAGAGILFLGTGLIISVGYGHFENKKAPDLVVGIIGLYTMIFYLSPDSTPLVFLLSAGYLGASLLVPIVVWYIIRDREEESATAYNERIGCTDRSQHI